jgi:hypothetical protein
MAARMTHALKVSPRRDDALQRPDSPSAGGAGHDGADLAESAVAA